MGEQVQRTAVVTGGSRGIGRAICLRLADEGMNILVNYSGNQAAAEEVAALCRQKGVEAEILGADVSTEEGCEALIAKAKEVFGGIDVLVNNAGITRDNLSVRISAEDFDKVIATNLRGAFLCSRAALKLMMRKRYGRIINISSVVGLHGNAGQCNYAAAKAGIIGLTKSLAKEWATRGITANAVAPGFIATDMTKAMPEAAKTAALASVPMGRMGEAEEVAEAVAFFAKETNGYITGQVLAVDGGMAM